MKLFLKISFLGTAYKGYQVQKNGITVQKVLGETAERVFGFPCDIAGCSRTDSGVHANMFCVTVTGKGSNSLSTTVPVEKIPVALNSFLPDDIAVNEASYKDENFHVRYDVKYKEYIYRIWNGTTKNPFLADRALFLPKKVDGTALDAMRQASASFVGKHDFSAFMAQGSKITDPVRTVYYADVTRCGEEIVFRVAADGFLYNMVRIMTGTLLDVASGKLEPGMMAQVIESRDRKRAGITAPPCGLYLNRVFYENYKEE